MIVRLSKYVEYIIENDNALPFDEDSKYINRLELINTTIKLSSIDEYGLTTDNDIVLTIHGTRYIYQYDEAEFLKIVGYFEAIDTTLN